MAIKKSELYAGLWQSCDELRGGMDASQYKDYVLVLLFMKYVSDKAASQRDYLLYVPPGARFADMVALKGRVDIGEGINKVIAKLAEANDGLKGTIDVADFNDPDKLGKGKDMVDRLSNLVAIFENPALDFGGNRAEDDDLLGDAYEYLMRHFATESGKSKGQFYTPAEVSRVMAQVIGLSGAKTGDQSIYDPTCGSGSLLLKAHDEAKVATGLDLAIYGQEMDNATSALARMNMVLHDAPTAEIWQDNTLSSPHFTDARTGRLKTFDWVVANPPFSTKSWGTGFNPAEDEYHRFPYGLPPRRNGDYAYLLHVLASLKSTGKGAVIMPHGVLFRGNAEGTIRREIVRRGYIKGIIGLPANLFYGTSIPACVIVLDKEAAPEGAGIFIMDASRGFMKDGNKNRLRAQDIHRIVDTFTRQVATPRYARLVPMAEIETNDFNLNIPRYIDSSEPEDVQDIDGHLRGGIPNRDLDALDRYWHVFPGVRVALFESAGRDGYSRLRVPHEDIKATVFGHKEFAGFNRNVMAIFDAWWTASRPRLRNFGKGDHPKTEIGALSESLLGTFREAQLIDAYDVYQRLMDYWTEVLHDAAAGAELMPQWRDLALRAGDEVTTRALYWSLPAVDALPPPVQGKDVFIVAALYAGDKQEGQGIIDEFRNLGTPLFDMTEHIPNYRAFQAAFDPLVTNLHSYWKSMYLSELNDEAMAFIHERAMNRPDPSVLIHIPIMGGATAAVAAEDTAFGDRSAPFMLSFDGGTYDPTKFNEVRQWVRDTIEAARRLDVAGGAYLNFSGDETTDERVVAQQFGGNLERLSAIKKQYDPGNLFRINNNIKPA